MGMREHHKYSIILHLDIYKRAILEDVDSLIKRGILKNKQDVFYLTLEELIDVEENNFPGDIEVFIENVKNKYEQFEKLTPPRVMTSEGETVTGRVRNIQAPEGALIGTPVSAGVIEGIARVVQTFWMLS